MGTGFSKRKKQAKQLQQQFMQMQDQMKEMKVEGTAANGLVSITLNGEGEMLAIKVKPECVDADDIEGLEMLIKTAHKDATDKLQKQSSSQLPAGMPDLSQFGF